MSPSPSPTEVPHDSPTSPTPPTQGGSSPLFKEPLSSMSPEQPRPSSTTSPEGTPDLSGGVPTWSADEPDTASDPGPAESSATPSTGKGLRLSKAGLRVGVGAGFRQVCKLLGAFLADETERDLGVWTPDQEDIDDVTVPAASIVYRRLPDDAKSGDLIDLVQLGMALIGYVGKNLAHRAAIREARRLQAVQGIDVSADATGPGGF